MASKRATAQSNHEWNLFKALAKATRQNVTLLPAEDEPGWLWQLVLAADQFVVKRALPGRSQMAEPHRGLSLVWRLGPRHHDRSAGTDAPARTPRDCPKNPAVSFARFVDAGMLPNNFPDASGSPEYNTVDATLWYFEAVRQYYEATQDLELVQELFPVLVEIVDAHVRGTRYNIKVDPADALLFAGQSRCATHLDGREDWRLGGDAAHRQARGNQCAVDQRAAHHGGFCASAGAAGRGLRKARGAKPHAISRNSGMPSANCCFDVIDVPGGGNDPPCAPIRSSLSLLPVSPLTERQQKAVVDTCAQHLLTSHGLRSLAPSDPAYKGHMHGWGSRARFRLSSGNGLGLAARAICAGALSVYRDRGAAQSVPGTARQDYLLCGPGHDRGNLRR